MKDCSRKTDITKTAKQLMVMRNQINRVSFISVSFATTATDTGTYDYCSGSFEPHGPGPYSQNGQVEGTKPLPAGSLRGFGFGLSFHAKALLFLHHTERSGKTRQL